MPGIVLHPEDETYELTDSSERLPVNAWVTQRTVGALGERSAKDFSITQDKVRLVSTLTYAHRWLLN